MFAGVYLVFTVNVLLFWNHIVHHLDYLGWVIGIEFSIIDINARYFKFNTVLVNETIHHLFVVLALDDLLFGEEVFFVFICMLLFLLFLLIVYSCNQTINIFVLLRTWPIHQTPS